MNIAVLIPSYEPDEKLAELTEKLTPLFSVVVVDDGSGDGYAPIFDEVRDKGAVVLRHGKNRGKGAALRTGIAYLKDTGCTDGIVTADSDGQHTVSDIVRVACAMDSMPDTLILGGRDFTKMPKRSRFGNTVSRFFFRLCTKLKISDTQTGLRGLPKCLFDKLLALPGDRYEYEMNMLLELKEWGCAYREIEIDTVYIDNNSGTHFHALRDGLLVFSRVIKYALSSLCCAGVDYLVYILLLLCLPVAWSYAAARVCSATLNYFLNCRVVFGGKVCVKSFISYAALAGFSMAVGAVLVSLLTQTGLGNVVSKLIVDGCLFVFNYFMQKSVIFKRGAASRA